MNTNQEPEPMESNADFFGRVVALLIIGLVIIGVVLAIMKFSTRDLRTPTNTSQGTPVKAFSFLSPPLLPYIDAI